MSFSLRHAAVLLALAVGACSNGNELPPSCPQVALLPDAGDLVRYRGVGRDITDTVLTARINAVPALCSRGPDGKVKATLRISASADRGPAATDRNATVSALVAVLDGDQVLDRQDYTLSGTFPRNVEHVTVLTNEIVLLLPNTRESPVLNKRILVGFLLTPTELENNRRRGVR